MLRGNEQIERVLPPPGRYRVTDGANSVHLDAANPGLRAQYSERYERQQQALTRLCRELGLHQIDVATNDDMLAELKAGLGLQ